MVCAPRLHSMSVTLEEMAVRYTAGAVTESRMNAYIYAWLKTLDELLDVLAESSPEVLVSGPPVIAS